MSRRAKVLRFSTTDCDVDALRQHYANTLKPVFLNPIGDRRTISAHDLHISIGDFDIWSGNCPSGMSVSFTEPPDLYALYLPLSGSMEFRQGTHTALSVPGGIFACDLAKLSKISLHENRSHIGIAFRRSTFVGHLSEITETPVDPNFDLFGETSADFDDGRLATMCRLVWDGLEKHPQEGLAARSNEFLLRAIMVRLLESVPHKYRFLMNRNNSPAMPRQVKLAIEFMVAHVSTPVTIDNIATAAGVSARSLQLAFQQFKDTTPLAYLRRLRLVRAKQELEAANNDVITIAAVAQRWGFSNVARFSTLYLRTFGETPKQTLSRNR
ncbi:AraC family transcriptional regulator [Rhizobium sp. P44RR-XXIV]|uniref:helix-turn-helix transcriptional regulator n=1 Tax=Rhizobium sp. P44RR-XXIV TaxID=1921145 RepID=UPI0009879219|nr:AraC family transcriptional regulator [Rhizobium sp. P44RR-XXIV]TIX90608.1 helix-turn-helix domain-containing protein [Rhizobium sp. P44RR-XXIV]